MPITPTTWLAPAKDGRLELFAVGSANARISVWHLYQIAPSGGWSAWTNHGLPPAGDSSWNGPAVAPNAEGRLELFFENNYVMWQQWQVSPNGGWSPWTSHGAPPGTGVTGNPTLGRSADGRLDMFTVGPGGVVWQKYQVAPARGWSDWVSHGIPGATVGARKLPVIASNADQRLELFVLGDDGALWHKYQTARNNGWSGWITHGQPPGAALDSLCTPAIGSSADGRLEVFAVGEDGGLRHLYQTTPAGGWSNWVNHGAPPGVKFTFTGRGPAVAPSADGRLELFLAGDDGNLWHKYQTARNNGWSGWVSHGCPPPRPVWGANNVRGQPAIAQNSQGRLELFIVADDSAMWHIWQTTPNGAWSAWTSHGTPPGQGFFGV